MRNGIKNISLAAKGYNDGPTRSYKDLNFPAPGEIPYTIPNKQQIAAAIARPMIKVEPDLCHTNLIGALHYSKRF
jgi:hypothetical protein